MLPFLLHFICMQLGSHSCYSRCQPLFDPSSTPSFVVWLRKHSYSSLCVGQRALENVYVSVGRKHEGEKDLLANIVLGFANTDMFKQLRL